MLSIVHTHKTLCITTEHYTCFSACIIEFWHDLYTWTFPSMLTVVKEESWIRLFRRWGCALQKQNSNTSKLVFLVWPYSNGRPNSLETVGKRAGIPCFDVLRVEKSLPTRKQKAQFVSNKLCEGWDVSMAQHSRWTFRKDGKRTEDPENSSTHPVFVLLCLAEAHLTHPNRTVYLLLLPHVSAIRVHHRHRRSALLL